MKTNIIERRILKVLNDLIIKQGDTRFSDEERADRNEAIIYAIKAINSNNELINAIEELQKQTDAKVSTAIHKAKANKGLLAHELIVGERYYLDVKKDVSGRFIGIRKGLADFVGVGENEYYEEDDSGIVSFPANSSGLYYKIK